MTQLCQTINMCAVQIYKYTLTNYTYAAYYKLNQIDVQN